MKKHNLTKNFAYVLLILCILTVFATVCGCQNDTPPEPPTDGKTMDVAIFMGQSNMAGRGEAIDSVVAEQGHGYEFRAVADPSKLYDVVEPFGATENNEALADAGQNGDGKKKGSMVSAFVEGYYEQTNTPLVCVSASVGGTSIGKWIPNAEETDYFEESKRRLTAAVDYLLANEYTVRRVFMVWCQGEADATRWVKGEIDYFGRLQSIVDGLAELGNGYGVSNLFLVTPSEFSVGSEEANANKVKLVDDMIAYCERTDNNCVLASVKFRNVPLNMRDDPHFHQGIYNVTGYDAGKNVASYYATNKYPTCTEFVLGEDVTLAEKFGIAPQYTSK